jgi:hypothetical protein
MQCFLVEMLLKFRFSHSVDLNLMGREAAAILSPVVRGEEERGSQLPLFISKYEP